MGLLARNDNDDLVVKTHDGARNNGLTVNASALQHFKSKMDTAVAIRVLRSILRVCVAA